ncbi:hypothetical protein ACJ72_08717 [Emergomyces africanus]|uniref:Uncharacterized protein n=1 Tax=Emergomyces africanus TaxID=1955775 RepID=A0A1B7NJE3_9EURO|nr:hypothetical protein ACJ72_08717 [Emergomyces africanus]
MRSAPSSRRVSLKRTYTDLGSVVLQNKLTEALAQPYSAGDILSQSGLSSYGLGGGTSSVHTHSSKWSPVSQAVFTTASESPWTILAANDLACLGFGVTEAEVKKLSILDLVQEERRQWLESKLRKPPPENTGNDDSLEKSKSSTVNTHSLGMGNGVTAQLLSKPPSHATNARRAKTEEGSDTSPRGAKSARNPKHSSKKSRGVLLCGDVVLRLAFTPVLGPDGKHLKDIMFTARNVTCTTWGGRNWDLVFATTAKDTNPESRGVDDGGHMFLYKPQDGSKGQAKIEFAG